MDPALAREAVEQVRAPAVRNFFFEVAVRESRFDELKAKIRVRRRVIRLLLGILPPPSSTCSIEPSPPRLLLAFLFFFLRYTIFHSGSRPRGASVSVVVMSPSDSRLTLSASRTVAPNGPRCSDGRTIL